jgi:hypothetical protein
VFLCLLCLLWLSAAISVAHTERVTPIPDHEVRSELDRILASKGFAGAGRLSKLLRYAVERTLAGETDQLKEYSVGIEVFERDQNYDPRLDSIVRVEAGRLRSRLDDYYNGDGASSTIRIGLPRGGYSAHFERKGESPVAAATTVPATPPRRSLVAAPLAIALICAIGGMVVWLAAWNRQPAGDPRPSIGWARSAWRRTPARSSSPAAAGRSARSPPP